MLGSPKAVPRCKVRKLGHSRVSSMFEKIVCTALAAVILFAGCGRVARAQDKPSKIPELNTILMESTYLIFGPKRDSVDKLSFGTAFLMGKPTSDPTKLYYVLITATHVFEDIQGDNATLKLRERREDGSYTQKLWNVKLRDKDRALYVKHKD